MLPKEKLHDKEGPEVDVIQRARTCYREPLLPLSESKSYTNSETFTAWGTECRSAEGLVGAPPCKTVTTDALDFHSSGDAVS